MFWRKSYDAFISYSHKDSAVVKPLVELLSLNRRRVFWDEQLQPGDRWDETIRSSVKASNVFVLFWCCDTRESTYALEEIRLALSMNKKIVPVKLCRAAVPPDIGEWQWIDLEHQVSHDCGTRDHGPASLPVAAGARPAAPMAMPAARPGGGWKLAAALCSAMLCLAAGLSVMLSRNSNGLPEVAVPQSAAPPPVATPPAAIESKRKGARQVKRPGSSPGVASPVPVPPASVEPAGAETPSEGPAPQPWWRSRRAAGAALLVLGAFCSWILWVVRRAQRHTTQTLDLTRAYLHGLARGPKA